MRVKVLCRFYINTMDDTRKHVQINYDQARIELLQLQTSAEERPARIELNQHVSNYDDHGDTDHISRFNIARAVARLKMNQ